MYMFENSKSRLDAISDGVFAVVLTLMVLDIKVPKTLTKVDLYATGFSVVIYFISFAVVGQYWIFHQELLHTVQQPSTNFLVLNFFYLVFICLVPFATSFISDHPGSRISATLFAVIIFMVDLFQFILFRLVIGERPKKENLNAHDWEEYRAASLMVLVAVIYILVGLLLPKWILVVIALGLGARTLNNTIGHRLQHQGKTQ